MAAGGIGTAANFSMQANISVSLAHTAISIFYLFLTPPIRALNTIRVSLTGSRALFSRHIFIEIAELLLNHSYSA